MLSQNPNTYFDLRQGWHGITYCEVNPVRAHSMEESPYLPTAGRVLLSGRMGAGFTYCPMALGFMSTQGTAVTTDASILACIYGLHSLM